MLHYLIWPLQLLFHSLYGQANDKDRQGGRTADRPRRSSHRSRSRSHRRNRSRSRPARRPLTLTNAPNYDQRRPTSPIIPPRPRPTLPEHVVQSELRISDGGNECWKAWDGKDWIPVNTSFYCVLCRAQLELTHFESHLGSGKHVSRARVATSRYAPASSSSVGETSGYAPAPVGAPIGSNPADRMSAHNDYSAAPPPVEFCSGGLLFAEPLPERITYPVPPGPAPRYPNPNFPQQTTFPPPQPEYIQSGHQPDARNFGSSMQPVTFESWMPPRQGYLPMTLQMPWELRLPIPETPETPHQRPTASFTPETPHERPPATYTYMNPSHRPASTASDDTFAAEPRLSGLSQMPDLAQVVREVVQHELQDILRQEIRNMFRPATPATDQPIISMLTTARRQILAPPAPPPAPPPPTRPGV